MVLSERVFQGLVSEQESGWDWGQVPQAHSPGLRSPGRRRRKVLPELNGTGYLSPPVRR